MLAYFGASLGSLSSYLTSLSIIGFYVLVKDWHKPLWPFIILGLLYFLISSINYTYLDIDNAFIKQFFRFMIVVVFGAELAQRTTTKDFYFILLLGGISVIINALIFPLANANFTPTYGRYSGFYLNPNLAGSICLFGYAISLSISKRYWKLMGAFIFTLAGILTFSRTFIVVWLIINFLTILQSKKNIFIPAIGVIVLVIVLTFSQNLTLNKERFGALQSVFGEEQIDTETIKKGSRQDTWALYYDMIMEKPLLGNGYLKLRIRKPYQGMPGVHNSFLMVLGEAGIIPFLLMLGIYVYLLIKSFNNFKTKPELFYISVVLLLNLMTGHGYFTNFQSVFISMFVFIQLQKHSLNINNEHISEGATVIE